MEYERRLRDVVGWRPGDGQASLYYALESFFHEALIDLFPNGSASTGMVRGGPDIVFASPTGWDILISLAVSSEKGLLPPSQYVDLNERRESWIPRKGVRRSIWVLATTFDLTEGMKEVLKKQEIIPLTFDLDSRVGLVLDGLRHAVRAACPDPREMPPQRKPLPT